MSEKKYYYIQEYEKVRKKRIIKIIILIILILIVMITGFRTGQKFYEIKNTNLNAVNTSVNSSVAKWKFNVKIVY